MSKYYFYKTRMDVDITTGQARISLWGALDSHGNSWETFYVTYADLGVNIPLDGASLNVLGSASQVVSAGSSLVTNDFLGAAAGVGNALASLLPCPGSKQPNGGVVALINDNMLLSAYFHDVIDDDNAHHGRPLCESRQLSTLGGYMEIDNPDVAITGTRQESEMLNSYLAGGFFYE